MFEASASEQRRRRGRRTDMRDALWHVLFYESGDLSLAAEHFPAHQARYVEFMRRGELLALGSFTDRAGAMAVFTTHEAAMEFASGDPFVEHGVVSGWQVREWRVATPD
jgi:uncharacterized protein